MYQPQNNEDYKNEYDKNNGKIISLSLKDYKNEYDKNNGKIISLSLDIAETKKKKKNPGQCNDRCQTW